VNQYTITVADGLENSGDLVMGLTDDGSTITVTGDTPTAQRFRNRTRTPPVTSTDPARRVVQFIGGSWPTYWKLTTDVALRPLEFGDLPGHEFHGNQWTGGGGTSETVTRAIKDIQTALPKTKVDLKNLHPAVARTVADRFVAFSRDFPGLATSGYLERVSVGEDEGYAYTEPRAINDVAVGASIILGADFFGADRDDDQAADAVRFDRSQHYHEYDSITGTVDHELGHVLDFYSQMKASTDLVDAYKEVDDPRQFTKQYIAGLGRYAAENPAEAIGEAVAQDRLGACCLTPDMQTIVDRLYDFARSASVHAAAGDWAAIELPERTCRGITGGRSEEK
jgi:hypothetical protein